MTKSYDLCERNIYVEGLEKSSFCRPQAVLEEEMKLEEFLSVVPL